MAALRPAGQYNFNHCLRRVKPEDKRLSCSVNSSSWSNHSKNLSGQRNPASANIFGRDLSNASWLALEPEPVKPVFFQDSLQLPIFAEPAVKKKNTSIEASSESTNPPA
jgi:hypothetical protein